MFPQCTLLVTAFLISLLLYAKKTVFQVLLKIFRHPDVGSPSAGPSTVKMDFPMLSAAALLILLAASAWTGIVAPNLLAHNNRSGLLLLQVETLLGLLVKDIIPHRELI